MTGVSAAANNRTRLGRVGIWSLELRFGDHGQANEAAAELDELGFGALWFPGGVGGDVLGAVDRLLDVTKTTTIATGIINIWKHEPRELGDWWKKQSADRKARTLLGLGVSHGPLIGESYGKPLAVTRDYLKKISAEGVPAQSLCLAALGPKMLELSRDQTAGAHPYLVTAEHSAEARKILGPNALLAPEQGVLLAKDAAHARELGLHALTHYRNLPNYVNNWRRLGFTEQEISNADQRLLDALFVWGSMDKVAARVNAHITAGADHVCVQLISGSAKPDFTVLRPAWRELAAALL